MKAQADKHWKNITYKVRDTVWLSGCNIKFTRPCWDLKNKQLRSFHVKEQIEAVYQLKQSAIMWIHDVFSLKLLHSCVNNPLSGQHMPLPALIVTEDEEEHWEVDDILNSR